MTNQSTEIQVHHLPAIGQTGRTGAELATWLGKEMGGNIAGLGVSPGYVIQLAREHDLGEEDLVVLVTAKKDFGASFMGMSKLLKQGLAVEAIRDVYQARAEIQCLSPENERSVSIHLIIRFTETFPGFDLDDDTLGAKLIDFFHSVRAVEHFRWVKYPDQAIRLICDVAEGFGITDPDTAVDAMTDGFAE